MFEGLEADVDNSAFISVSALTDFQITRDERLALVEKNMFLDF